MDSPKQSHVRVDVAFYDDAERKKLLAYATGPTMLELTAAPIEVPTAEFLIHYLFHRKRLGSPGFRDRAAISRKTGTAIANLDGAIEFSGHSIRTADGVTSQLNEVSEHIGESIGLSVVSRIHGLHEADWTPIPTQSGKKALPSFDFEFPTPGSGDGIASDGSVLIQVEAKGSSAIDNRKHSPAVAKQKRLIERKKAKMRSADSKLGNVVDSTVRYGAIVVVDPRPEGNVRCWLTDPPGDETTAQPRIDRLLRRLQYMREWITFISPRSQLAGALATRIADLTALTNAFDLDGVPLMRGSGEPFLIDSDFAAVTFWNNKSAVGDDAGGVVLQISRSALIFLGIRRELLDLALGQSFTSISSYSYEAKTLPNTQVTCVVTGPRFKAMQLPASLDAGSPVTGSVSFVVEAHVHYSRSGALVAMLPLPAS